MRLGTRRFEHGLFGALRRSSLSALALLPGLNRFITIRRQVTGVSALQTPLTPAVGILVGAENHHTWDSIVSQATLSSVLSPQTVHRICISVRLATGTVCIVGLISASARGGQLLLPSYSAAITSGWKHAVPSPSPVAEGADSQTNRASLPDDEMVHQHLSPCSKHHSGTLLSPDTCDTFVSDSSPCLAS